VYYDDAVLLVNAESETIMILMNEHLLVLFVSRGPVHGALEDCRKPGQVFY